MEIMRLCGDRTHDAARGADVDVDPLADRSKVICLNETNRQRAEIVRRYRLYTYQPDEMVTMMSLASMRPGQRDFDPKLYQYGGLWIYPVGLLLRLASMTGAVSLRADLVYYLDHPEAFARFYVVARLYCAAWGLLGVWAVFWIARRLSGGSLTAGTAAAACFIAMPVVVNMAHEAKPHLPGAVLMLLTVAAAMRYVETGRRRWWLAASCLCGASFGMVLSALPIFVILPAMTAMRRPRWCRWFLLTCVGGLIGAAVYLLANPYVAINAVTNRQVLRSNLGNTLAMFEAGNWGEGLINAGRWIGEGTSILLAVAGAVGLTIVLHRRIRAFQKKRGPRAGETGEMRSGLGWLLAVPAVVILLQFTATAAGKPGEYGRFAVFLDVALGIGAVVSVYELVRSRPARRAIAALLIGTTACSGLFYEIGFVRDCRTNTSRDQAAELIRSCRAEGYVNLGVEAEPAPYVMPPANLFDGHIYLLPPGHGGERHRSGTIGVQLMPLRAVAAARSSRQCPVRALPWDMTPISWADKTFELVFRTEPLTGIED